MLASGSSLSLFADRQILEIRIPSGKPGKEGSTAIQQLDEAAQNNQDTLTLVVLPRLDAATKKGAWFGALDNFGVMLQVEPVDRQALPGPEAECDNLGLYGFNCSAQYVVVFDSFQV